MGKYQRYEKYKDSGVEWLGKIPEGWDIKRLRFILKEQFANGLFKKREYWGKGNPIINVFDVYTENNIVDVSTLDKVECDEEELSKYSALYGDFFFVRSSLKLEGIGKSATLLKPSEQIVFECHLVRGRPDSSIIDPKLLISYLNCHLARATLVSKANQVTMATIDQSKLKDIFIPLPPLDEQKAIARFLDHKTKQIDDLIAKKETLIEKLDEKRTALISHAVTRGLDPNVPMKDSGVKWLGQIPKHWEVMHLKRKAQVRGGVAKGRKLDKEETLELPYLRVANVQEGYIDISDISYIEVLHNEIERYSLHDGDVLMNEGGDNDKLGRGAVWKAEINPCLHQNHVFSVRPNDKRISSWIALLTSSFYAKFYFFSRAKQSTNLASISSTNIKLFPAIFPPESERQEIINYISNITTQIDQQKAKVQEAIELLKEYRTALITNAVTGKIDVRQVPIP